MIRRTYLPEHKSKRQIEREKQAARATVVMCNRCGATNKTLRKLPLYDEFVYYCEDCIKAAMKAGQDVRTFKEEV